MDQVFISYARLDGPVVVPAGADLRAMGVRAWLDQRDIPVSVPWLEEVVSAIDGADVVVFCRSAHWDSSYACQLERDLAIERHKYIVEIRLDGPIPTAPRQLAHFIADAFHRRPPLVRQHSFLTERSAIWDRSDRAKGWMISGATLRVAQALQRRGDPPLTELAHNFLRACVRQRRRRRWTVAAAIVTTLLLLSACGLASVAETYHKHLVSNANSVLAGVVPAQDALAKDIYLALAEDSRRILADGETFLNRKLVVDALSVPVPDIAYHVSGADLVGFGAAQSDSTPAVLDTTGARWVGQADVQAGVPLPAGTKLRAIASSNDGRNVALQTSAGTILDLGGHQVTTPPADAVAVSANGNEILSVENGRIFIRDGTGAVQYRSTAPPACCSAAVLAGHTPVLAAKSGALFATQRKSPTNAWTGHTGQVVALAASGDGRRVAVGYAREGTVRILAVPAMSPDLVLGSVGEPGALAFSPDNRLLAVGSGPDVAVFDVSSGQRVTTLRGSVGAVRQITWSTQANRVWALTADGHVAGWRWRAGRLLVNDPAQWFVALAGPDQHGRVAAVNRNGSFYLVDTSAQSVSAARHTDLPTVLSAAMTRQTGVLAVGSPNTVALLDLDHDSQRRMPLPDCTPTGLAFAADGKRLYVACGGGQVREYSIADGSLIHSTSAAGLAAYSVATDDAGDVIVGDEFGHVVQVGRNLDQASVLHGDNCAGVIRAVSLDPSGKWLESAGDGASHVGCLFEAHHGATGWTWNANIQQADIGEQARAIAIEPGGATALIGFSDGTVRFWQTGSLDASGVYHDFGGEVRGLVPSADGSQLVIATRDGILEVAPGCPLCNSTRDLAALASQRLDRARQMGLTQR
jgi:WD40 repeat protein